MTKIRTPPQSSQLNSSSAISTTRPLSARLAVFQLALRHHGLKIVRGRDVGVSELRIVELRRRLGLGLCVLALLTPISDTLIEREVGILDIAVRDIENILTATDTAIHDHSLHGAPPLG